MREIKYKTWNDVMRNSYPSKTKQEHYFHFNERLSERYGILISEQQYDLLCTWFKPAYSKAANKTIGSVFIGNVTVWCLYEKDALCLSTAYPQIIAEDPIELMRACFGNKLLPFARIIYDAYIAEKNSIKMDFETPKEAALFYFSNTLFPTMHIDTFRQDNISPFKLMCQIRNVLDGSSPYLKLQVARKDHETHEPKPQSPTPTPAQ